MISKYKNRIAAVLAIAFFMMPFFLNTAATSEEDSAESFFTEASSLDEEETVAEQSEEQDKSAEDNPSTESQERGSEEAETAEAAEKPVEETSEQTTTSTDETAELTAPAANTPKPKKTKAPEKVSFSQVYAVIEKGTVVFADFDFSEKMGKFQKDGVVYCVAEKKGIVKFAFAAESGDKLKGYFAYADADSFEVIPKEEQKNIIAEIKDGKHITHSGDDEFVVGAASFSFVKKKTPEPTREPEEKAAVQEEEPEEIPEAVQEKAPEAAAEETEEPAEAETETVAAEPKETAAQEAEPLDEPPAVIEKEAETEEDTAEENNAEVRSEEENDPEETDPEETDPEETPNIREETLKIEEAVPEIAENDTEESAEPEPAAAVQMEEEPEESDDVKDEMAVPASEVTEAAPQEPSESETSEEPVVPEASPVASSSEERKIEEVDAEEDIVIEKPAQTKESSETAEAEAVGDTAPETEAAAENKDSEENEEIIVEKPAVIKKKKTDEQSEATEETAAAQPYEEAGENAEQETVQADETDSDEKTDTTAPIDSEVTEEQAYVPEVSAFAEKKDNSSVPSSEEAVPETITSRSIDSEAESSENDQDSAETVMSGSESSAEAEAVIESTAEKVTAESDDSQYGFFFETEDYFSESEDADESIIDPSVVFNSQPTSFTPSVTLSGEGLARSFTLSADSYNKAGAELGGKTQITVQPGQTASFGEISFTAAGTYGFAIRDDAAFEKAWDLTVVVAENSAAGMLYVNTQETVYVDPDSPSSANPSAAVFHASSEVPEAAEKKVYTPVSVNLTAQVHTTVNGEEALLPIGSYPDAELTIVADSANSTQGVSVPLPDDDTVSVSLESNTQNSEVVSFDEITFEEPGTYSYLVETQDSACLTFSSKSLALQVDVTSDEDDVLTSSITSKDTDSDGVLIANGDVETGSLTIKKIYEDSDTKSFSFTVSFDDTNVASSYGDNVPGSDGNGTSVVSNFSLKNGESKLFKNIPIGTEYTIVENENAYEASFVDSSDPEAEGTANTYTGIISDAETVVTVTNVDTKFATAELKAHWFLLGTYFSELTSPYYYIYPGISKTNKLSFDFILKAEESDAPMPAGSKFHKLTVSVGFYQPNFSPKSNRFASTTVNFGSMMFKDNLLADGQNERTFTYTISHKPSEQPEEYDFIDYNTDMGTKSREKEVTVKITLHRDPNTGDLWVDDPIYTQNESDLFPSTANFEEEADFLDAYLSTKIAILKKVSGTGSSTSDTFKLLLDLGTSSNPLKYWYFYVQCRESTNATVSKTTTRTGSTGNLSYTVSDGGYIYVYGVPNGKRYEIDESYTNTNYYPTYTVKKYDEDNNYTTIKTYGTIEADNYGNYWISCGIVNTYSSVPLTGYGDPNTKTYAIICCLLIALTAGILRKRLDGKEE